MTKRGEGLLSFTNQRTRKAEDEKAYKAAFPIANNLVTTQKSLEKKKSEQSEALMGYEKILRQSPKLSEEEIRSKVAERKKELDKRSDKNIKDLERRLKVYENALTPPAKEAAIQRTKNIRKLIWRYIRRFGVPDNRRDFIQTIKRRKHRLGTSYKGGDPFPLADRKLRAIVTDLAREKGTPGRKSLRQS